MKITTFGAVAAASIASATFGENYTWKAVDSDWSGSYTNTAHWTPASETYPGEWDEGESHLGDYALFDFQNGTTHVGITPEIMFPEGIVTNFAGIYYRSTQANVATFNGTNTVFVMPKPTKGGSWGYDSDAGVPTAFSVAAGAKANSSMIRASDGNCATWRPGTFSNFLFTVSNAAAERKVTFASGAYDFGSFAYHLFFGQSYSATTTEADAFIEVGKDASLSTENIAAFGTPSPRNVFTVKGELTLKAQLQLPSSIQNVYLEAPVEQELALEAREGGKIKLTGMAGALAMGLSYTRGGVVQNTDRLTCRILADNGVIEQKSSGLSVSSAGAGRHELVFRNGSVGSFAGNVSLGNAARSAGVVSVDDSELTFGSTLTLGGGESASGHLAVTNGTVTFKRPFCLKAGSAVLADGARIALDKAARLYGDGASTTFLADDATLAVAADTTYEPLSGFTSATVDAGGFVIDAPTAVTISQPFGGTGTLTLSGAGKKTLSGDIACAKVVVTGGGVDFTGVVTAVVEATDGATVSFGGNSTVENPLAGLVLGGTDAFGVLKIKPSEEIFVTAAPAFGPLRLALSGGFALGGTVKIHTQGQMSEASLQSWAKAQVVSGLPAGTAWATSVGEESGGTVLTLEIVDGTPIEVSVETGTETHETNIIFGAGQTLSASAAKDAKAVFSGDLGNGRFEKTGEGSVELSGSGNSFAGGLLVNGGLLSAATLAALGLDSFSAVSTLADGTLELKEGGLLGATFDLNATKGANALVILKTDGDVTMPIPSATQGAIIKRGKGRLTFEVGKDTDWKGLNGNTLNKMGVGESIALDDVNGTAPGTDKHYGAVNVAEGELVFRGTGETVPTVAFHESNRPGTDIGLSTTPVASDFAQPGLVLDHVRYDLSRNANFSDYFAMSLKRDANSPEGITDPYLVISNGAVLECTMFAPGWRNNDARCSAHVLLDNGTINCHYEMHASENSFDPTKGAVTNDYTLRNGSAIYSDYKEGRLYVTGQTATFDVDGSTIAKDATGAPLSMYASQRTGIVGRFNFRNGSYFGCDRIWMGGGSASQVESYTYVLFDLSFDGSEWYIGEGNLDFPSSNMNVTVTSTGAGLKVNPPLGSEWRLYTKVQGDGGLVKGGAGTLFIDNWFRYQEYEKSTQSWIATGDIAVNGGTLALKPTAIHGEPVFLLGGEGCALELRGENAALTNAVIGGTGAIRGGTFANLRVAATADAATETFNVLTIDGANGAALSGRTVFDFGKVAGDPVPLFDEPKVIARWTGAKPDVSKWKAVNTGVPSAKLNLTVNDDGTIDGQIVQNGLMLIVR